MSGGSGVYQPAFSLGHAGLQRLGNERYRDVSTGREGAAQANYLLKWQVILVLP